MSQIHILDGQNDLILDYVQADDIIDDSHRKSLEDTLETYDFIAIGNRNYTEHLEKRNRLIIPDEDGSLIEFVIYEVARYKDTEGHKVQAFSHASYLELKKAAIIYPDKQGKKRTASQHAGFALNDTGWQIGTVEASGEKTLSISEHTSPYEFLKHIAKEYGVELRFRVEHDGTKITGRYVDLLQRVGEWRGREVEFGRDLDGIRRVEKQDIVTALLGLGPEREDGSRIEVLVEDFDALERWGRIDENGNLKHLIEPYEIESERTEMTDAEARQYTKTALNKRINTQVTYECTIVDLENVPGLENEKIRFGDTIRIKDTSFIPALYLEARVFEQERSIKTTAKKDIKLGDFIEYTEEDVNAIWKQLKEQIQNRVSHYEMAEYTYDKLTIDDKDETVFEDGKTFAEATGIQAREDAKAFAVQEDSKIKLDVEQYADTVAEQKANSALEQAKMYAVAQEVYDIQMQQIASDIASRAPLEYVDGKLRVIEDELEDFNVTIEEKADKSTVYTIEEVDNRINNLVSVTQYTTDMDGIVTQLESHGTRIGQNEHAIGLKADASHVDSVEQSLTTKIGNVEVKADGVITQVSEVRADLDGLEIGGRNLILNTGNLTFSTSEGIINKIGTDMGVQNVYKIDGLTNRPIFINPAEKYSESLREGQEYTISFLIRYEGVKGNQPSIYLNSPSGGYQKAEGTMSDTSYSTIYRTFVAKDIKTFRIHIQPNGYECLYISANVKLEKGNKATDWSPAPEDTDEAINQVSGRVETLDGEITALAGEVSLKASQSVVDSLEGRVSTAEGELKILPGEINAKVSKNGVIGALNLSPETALIDFKRVKMTGELEAKHIKSLAGLNINNQFIVDASGNVRFAGALQGASGTFGEVTVNEGDITIKDKNSNVKSILRDLPNLLGDHNFERLLADWTTENTTYNWYEMKNPSYSQYDFSIHKPYWVKYGSPKVSAVPEYGVLDYRAKPIFDNQAVVVRDGHFVRQFISEGIGAGGTYTISGYFKRQWGLAAGVPRFEVDHMRGGQRLSRLINHTYNAVPNDYTPIRYATSFTVPTSFKEEDYLEIKVSGGNANWVQADGVQLVEGSLPANYNPESTAFLAMNRGSQLTLWTGAAFPNATPPITPIAPLSECDNGWLLKWQAYNAGQGIVQSDFQYSYIPKSAEFNLGTGHRFFLNRDGINVVKYLYITNTSIKGFSANGSGDNANLVLSEVLSW